MQRRKIRKKLEDGLLGPSKPSSQRQRHHSTHQPRVQPLPVPQPAAMAHSRNGFHDPDLAFRWIEANRNFPRYDEAMKILQRLSSFVKPILRKRGWQVGTLAEFYPEQANLLGVNINHGERICLRLRYQQDVNQFLPFEAVTDTLLHELSHNVRGPHDEIFHRVWNELRDEAEQLLYSGFTGESFLGRGQQLGGYGVPQAEKQRRARAEALRRRQSQRSQGHVLGGHLPRSSSLRDAVAGAADRRAGTALSDGCGSGTREGIIAAEEAQRLGFRSQQEMDNANDIAIQKALIELMEEDRLQLPGSRPMAEGLTWSAEKGLDFGAPEPSRSAPPIYRHPPPVPSTETRPPVPPKDYQTGLYPAGSSRSRSTNSMPPPALNNRPGRPVSRLVSEDEARRRQDYHAAPSGAISSGPYHSADGRFTWTCGICTLANKGDYLVCDACGTERPESVQLDPASPLQTMKGGRRESLPVASVKANEPWGWNCGHCGTFMENQWWTCSACGLMKASS